MGVDKHNYCLYRKEIERELGASERNSREGEEIEVRLELIHTDFDTEEERGVNKYISHKANRNMIYTNGQIGILPTFVSRSKISKTTICYFSLLEIESEKGKEEYIICIVCEVDNDEGFALFRKDLDDFCDQLREGLTKWTRQDIPLAQNSSLLHFLPLWWEQALGYVTRVTAHRGVAVALRVALSGIPVRFSGPPEKAAEFRRFLRAAALPESGVDLGSPGNSWPEGGEHSVEVVWENESWSIQSNATNVFCCEWARELRQCSDPLQARNLMENYKHRMSQDLITLGELTHSARLNNYSLYEAYRFLQRNSNSDVLLLIALRISRDSEDLEVLQVIQEYLQSQLTQQDQPKVERTILKQVIEGEGESVKQVVEGESVV